MKRLILLISMAGFLISCSESGWKDLRKMNKLPEEFEKMF